MMYTLSAASVAVERDEGERERSTLDSIWSFNARPERSNDVRYWDMTNVSRHFHSSASDFFQMQIPQVLESYNDICMNQVNVDQSSNWTLCNNMHQSQWDLILLWSHLTDHRISSMESRTSKLHLTNKYPQHQITQQWEKSKGNFSILPHPLLIETPLQKASTPAHSLYITEPYQSPLFVHYAIIPAHN